MKNSNLNLNGYVSVKFVSTLLDAVDCLLGVCVDAEAPVRVLNSLNIASHHLLIVLSEFREQVCPFDGVKHD